MKGSECVTMIDYTTAIDGASGYAAYGSQDPGESEDTQEYGWPPSDGEMQPVALQPPDSQYCNYYGDQSEIASLQQQLAQQKSEIAQLQREYQSGGGSGTTGPARPPCGGDHDHDKGPCGPQHPIWPKGPAAQGDGIGAERTDF